MISRIEPTVSAAHRGRPVARDAHRHASAFTLVEILLVVAIISIATLVTMPSLVRSIRGNRLRTAASSIVRVNQYARAMAILKQQEAVLGFDISNATVTVTFQGRAPASPKPATNTEERVTDMAASSEPAADDNTTAESGGQNPNVTRVLDGVTIEYVELETLGRKTDGLVSIVYQTNGRCESFKVRLVDDRGEGTTIAVDELATATTPD